LAQLNLADCHAEGLGVSKDIVQAIELYLRVADRPGEARHWGDRWNSETEWTDDHYAVDAWRKLGALYLSGLGVTKDEAEAYAYHSLVGQDSETDRKAIADLEAKLKPSELNAGKRRAKELREKLNAKRQQSG
jgi:TPR repeat protein